MGYDMYLQEVDETITPPDPVELAAAQAKFHEFLRAEREVIGDQSAVDALEEQYRGHLDHYRELSRQQDLVRGYFRLNIWGMGEARQIMDLLGMLQTGYVHPPWPKPEAFDIGEGQHTSWDDYWKYTDDLPEGKVSKYPKDCPSNVIAFHTAQQELLEWYPENPSGICVHKLGSNDGWLVTPEECRAAIQAYINSLALAKDKRKLQAFLAERGWFQEWLEYLRIAVDRGGFRVW